MQQFSVDEYYDLGKKIQLVEREAGQEDAHEDVSSLMWPLFLTRWGLERILREPSPLLSASQRAARSLIASIDEITPKQIEDVFKIQKPHKVYPYLLGQIETAIKNFETILKNDMPEMSTFSVSQIGMFRTEDLINLERHSGSWKMLGV